MTPIDMNKARREGVRWLILLTLNNARPLGHYDDPVLTVVRGMYPDASQQEIRREIDYLAMRDLVEVKRQPHGPWHCALTRYGVDMAEYTIDCEPGIARPARYW